VSILCGLSVDGISGRDKGLALKPGQLASDAIARAVGFTRHLLFGHLPLGQADNVIIDSHNPQPFALN
jgi:hypothetical protein